MQTVLDEAIEQYRRDQFFKELNAGYASLQSDAEAWNEELTDRQSWDGTLLDGI